MRAIYNSGLAYTGPPAASQGLAHAYDNPNRIRIAKHSWLQSTQSIEFIVLSPPSAILKHKWPL
jgi:hypothetical protein